MSHMEQNVTDVFREQEFRDELRVFIQEEVWKAFDVAMRAAVNAPTAFTGVGNMEKENLRQIRSEAIREVNAAIKSALNHLKADAQARVVEKTDPERAKRIRALADPTF
jgi:hypothetical protein